jgi:hypothetical protein
VIIRLRFCRWFRRIIVLGSERGRRMLEALFIPLGITTKSRREGMEKGFLGYGNGNRGKNICIHSVEFENCNVYRL